MLAETTTRTHFWCSRCGFLGGSCQPKEKLDKMLNLTRLDCTWCSFSQPRFSLSTPGCQHHTRQKPYKDKKTWGPQGRFFNFYLFVWLHQVLVVSCGLLWLQGTGSRVGWLRSCPMACGILVPQPGMESTSPILEGGFLTTWIPEKSPSSSL